jgi:predicted glycosyltransferase
MGIIQDIINPKPIKLFLKIHESKDKKGIQTYMDEKAITELDATYLIQVIAFLDGAKMIVLKDLERRDVYLQQPQQEEVKE